MTEEISLEELWEYVERARVRFGMTDEDDRAMINSGWNRTPEKRELLRRIEERCKRMGVPFYGRY